MAAVSCPTRFCLKFKSFPPLFKCNSARIGIRHAQTISKSKDQELQKFFRKDVQEILQRITEFDVKQTFSGRKAEIAAHPKYNLFSDQELEEEKVQADKIVKERLQMPPCMDVRAPCNDLLADDPDIAPTLTSNYVFIDVSDSEGTDRISVNTQRPAVCRYTNGQLRRLNLDLVDMITQIYDPVDGREILMPKMFEEDQLEKILTPEKYTYILERACVQFEPNSSDFVRVTHRVYEHVFQKQSFDALRATRFFGPMTFYLARMNKIERLLIYLIKNNRVSDAKNVINLKRILYNQPVSKGSVFHIISNYMKTDVNKAYASDLNAALKDHSERTPNIQE